MPCLLKESDSETYARERIEQLGPLRLRKRPALRSTASPDYDILANGEAIAVAEVKSFDLTPRTAENNWAQAPNGGVTRTDNAPARVAAVVHRAVKQLAPQLLTRVLVLVNDERLMDHLDLLEALDGYLDYGDDQVGYFRNTAFQSHDAVKRIQAEKSSIDLFTWFDRYVRSQLPTAPEGPFLLFASEAGYELARSSFSEILKT